MSICLVFCWCQDSDQMSSVLSELVWMLWVLLLIWFFYPPSSTPVLWESSREELWGENIVLISSLAHCKALSTSKVLMVAGVHEVRSGKREIARVRSGICKECRYCGDSKEGCGSPAWWQMVEVTNISPVLWTDQYLVAFQLTGVNFFLQEDVLDEAPQMLPGVLWDKDSHDSDLIWVWADIRDYLIAIRTGKHEYFFAHISSIDSCPVAVFTVPYQVGKSSEYWWSKRTVQAICWIKLFRFASAQTLTQQDELRWLGHGLLVLSGMNLSWWLLRK